MSIELVKAEVAYFLKDSNPGVLCIRGKWGVGKTYTWEEQLRAAHAEGRLGIMNYAYVPLFGLNSLDALKAAVFENSQDIRKGIRVANLATLEAFVTSQTGWRKAVRAFFSGPVISHTIGQEVVRDFLFADVRNMIVCLDDFERLGDGLKPIQVLGLVSFLREQRKCKVVLILNDEKLREEAKPEFERHVEKVVDVSLTFELPAADAARIGVSSAKDDDVSRLISERCVALGITNIRTIQRIVRFIERLRPKLADLDAEVLRRAISSLTLFCWSRDQPDDAPSLNYLERKRYAYSGLMRKHLERKTPGSALEPPTAERAEDETWEPLLIAYGYTRTDEFDLVLIEAVRKGYFDDAKLRSEALKVNAELARSHGEYSFGSAWRKFYDSFADDQKEVLDGISNSFTNNVEYLSPMNLNDVVSVFKRLGRSDVARQMIDHYVNSRNESREFFDLEVSVFGNYVTDPDVRKAFAAKFESSAEVRDIVAMLTSIKEQGFSPERLEALAAMPTEEYTKAFKSHSGTELHHLIASALQFQRIANATPEMLEITKRAKDALGVIGAGSQINALRVSRLGVTPRQPPPAEPQHSASG